MDMYQKREMRKNKKMDENTKSLPSTSINWYIPTLINFPRKPYFTRAYIWLLFTFLYKKLIKIM